MDNLRHHSDKGGEETANAGSSQVTNCIYNLFLRANNLAL